MAEGPPDNNGVDIGFPLNWRDVPDITQLKWKSLLSHLNPPASNLTADALVFVPAATADFTSIIEVTQSS